MVGCRRSSKARSIIPPRKSRMSTATPDPRIRLRQLYEACPLCESKRFGRLREDDCRGHAGYDPGLPPTMVWCLCQDCGHCFVEGYLTAEGLDLLFKKTQDVQSPAAVFRPPDPSWLPGHFPVEQHRLAWARIVERVTRLRGGLPTRADRWLDVQDFTAAPGSLAVISMADVLEHMPFPKPALRHSADLLRPDGLLFLSMPNGDTIVWKYLDSYKVSPYWIEIEHCHNFTKDRLFALLTETGFEPLDYDINHRYRSGMDIVARKRAG